MSRGAPHSGPAPTAKEIGPITVFSNVFEYAINASCVTWLNFYFYIFRQTIRMANSLQLHDVTVTECQGRGGGGGRGGL